MSFKKMAAHATVVATLCCASAVALAHEDAAKHVNIRAGDLSTAIETLAEQCGVYVIYPSDQLKGLYTAGVSGTMQTAEAFAKLLQGTPLTLSMDEGGALLIALPAPLGEKTSSTSGKGERPPAASDEPMRRHGFWSRLHLAQSTTTSATAEDQDENVSGAGRRANARKELHDTSAGGPSRSNASELEEIVVTGTHISGAGPVGAQSIVLTDEQIKDSGRITTADIIRSLPQNSGVGYGEETRNPSNTYFGNTGYSTPANLRGLGPDATLVLFNGHRIAPSIQGNAGDLTQIPVTAIGRVEVVLDGSSAIYGSDAIGGVINIIPKTFDRPQTRLSHTFIDGSRRDTVSQSLGFNWDTGFISAWYEHFHQAELNGSDRYYSTRNMVPFGGTDARYPYSSPGTIIANGQTYAIPSGQDGTNLSPSQLIAGTQNYFDYSRYQDILPRQDRHSAVISAEQRIGERTSLYIDGVFSTRSFKHGFGANIGALTVPNSNPFFVSPVPGATATTVYYNYLGEFGPTYGVRGTQQDVNFTGGIKLEPFAGWTADIFYAYGQDKLGRRLLNSIGSLALAAALADPDPATAFNPFGDGSANNPDTLAKLLTDTALISQGYRLSTVGFSANGTVLDLPSGAPLKASVGAEYRGELFHTRQVNLGSTPQPRVAEDLRIHRDDRVVYGELLAPLIGAGNRHPMMYGLELSAALRAERYSDFGNATTARAGVHWQPIHDLTIRGSIGSAFKAPQLYELGFGTYYYSARIADPVSPTGSSFILLKQGGNADLDAEHARTVNIGVDVQPSAVPQLRVGASYFDTRYRNRIYSLGSADYPLLLLEPDIYATVLNLSPTIGEIEAIYSSPSFAGTQIDPSQIVAIADGGFRNIGSLRESGFDLQASYRLVFDRVTVTLRSSSQYITRYETKATPTAPAVDNLNKLGFPLRFTNRSGFSWDAGSIGGSLFLSYVNSYRNTNVPTLPKIPSWTTLDGTIRLTSGDRPGGWLNGFELSIAVQNLLDAHPPLFGNTAAGVAYDPQAASALERAVTISLEKQW